MNVNGVILFPPLAAAVAALAQQKASQQEHNQQQPMQEVDCTGQQQPGLPSLNFSPIQVAQVCESLEESGDTERLARLVNNGTCWDYWETYLFMLIIFWNHR